MVKKPKVKANSITSGTVLTLRARVLIGGILILLAILLIVAAGTIPFLFESPSIHYKFGMDKLFLRTGKILGLTAAVLLFLQVVLASRLKILDRIFSLNRIYSFHRTNGIIITSLILAHPILIIASENFTFFPIEKRYWPEFLGVGISIFILVLMVTAHWRLFLAVTYDKWLRFHRIGALLTTMLMFIHILFVSETFTSGLPRNLVFGLAGMNFLLIARLWYKRFSPGKRTYVIANVEQVAIDAYSLDVRPDDGRIFNYIPGQFAFITPISGSVPKEEHPFTLSSTPSRPDTLQFIIRSVGDWTSKVPRLSTGEHVFIDGPYGLFSHVTSPQHDPIIMIAGGIGITPMLSMLRYMADVNDQRQILLIWSNKTKEHIVYPEEFKDLRHRLQGLQIIHVVTGDTIGGGKPKRLDQATLERLLNGYGRNASVFICGPPGMMKEVSRMLRKLGFLFTRVYKEEFKF